jgi:hypothetical protein
MEGSTMGNHRSRTVEWVLRAVEVAAVFSAMSWALFWALTHRRSALAAPRTPPSEAEDLTPIVVGPGDQLDSDDPDGGGALERSRRRRHID